MPLIPCHDCNGTGHFVLGNAGDDDDRYAGDCERCGGTGEVEAACHCCGAVAALTSTDDDGHGYCHACNVVHFRTLARDRFRAALRSVVAFPEAAE